jgi:acyl-CoA dehydrogenase
MSSNPSPTVGQRGIDSEALAEVMRAHGLRVNSALTIEPLTGGQSNPTYRIHGGDSAFVLRKQPPGKLLASAHAIDREYRVMQALRDTGVPVPQMYFYCDDVSIAGTPFYLMEFLDGRVMVDQSLPGMAPEDRTAIYREMNRVLSALHRVDPAAVGLADFGRAGNYFGRQIARWTRQYQESRTEDIAAMESLAQWLPSRIPAGEQTSIVHGDFRLDNLVFHPSSARVIGVLDWELSTLGHPLADLSYQCMGWHIPPALWRGIGGLDLQALGIPSDADYVRMYGGGTAEAALENWDFYLAYNLFRMASILQGVAKRALDGSATASDAVETGRKARPLAELGWSFAQRFEASHRR